MLGFSEYSSWPNTNKRWSWHSGPPLSPDQARSRSRSPACRLRRESRNSVPGNDHQDVVGLGKDHQRDSQNHHQGEGGAWTQVRLWLRTEPMISKMPTVIHDLYSMLRLFTLWLVLSMNCGHVMTTRWQSENRTQGSWVGSAHAASVLCLQRWATTVPPKHKKLIIIQLSISNGTNSFQLSATVWPSPTYYPPDFLQHLKMNKHTMTFPPADLWLRGASMTPPLTPRTRTTSSRPSGTERTFDRKCQSVAWSMPGHRSNRWPTDLLP